MRLKLKSAQNNSASKVAEKSKGGRPRGSLNKKTLEKIEAERLVALKVITGQDVPLAKEVLEKLMVEAYGMAQKYRPSQVDSKKNDAEKAQDYDRWVEWGKIAAHLAKELAPYQSPTFKAVAMKISDDTKPKDVVTELLDMLDVETRGAPLAIAGPGS